MLSDDEILQPMRERVNHPATSKELVQLLKIGREDRAAFKRRLRALVRGRARVEIRGSATACRSHESAGGPRVHQSAGLCLRRSEVPTRICRRASTFIGSNLNQAMHGDRVWCAWNTSMATAPRVGSSASSSGAAKNIVGRYEIDDSGQGFVVPFDRRLTMDVQVPRGEAKTCDRRRNGGRWKITRFPTPTRPALGRIVEVLGPIDAPGVDTAVIIRKYNLEDAHSAAAIAEAHRMGGSVREKDIAGRTDFRQWPTGDDRRRRRARLRRCDFHRSAAERQLLARRALADVSHYVRDAAPSMPRPTSGRTSVYFPERAVHMLSHTQADLSTGLCSLNPACRSARASPALMRSNHRNARRPVRIRTTVSSTGTSA
jgi:ribonuclease R